MKLADLAKEIQTLKSLRHERLIRLHAVCSAGEPVYIVTELMCKGNLQAFLGSECRPPAACPGDGDTCPFSAWPRGRQWALPNSGLGSLVWAGPELRGGALRGGVPGFGECKQGPQPLSKVRVDPAWPGSPSLTWPSSILGLCWGPRPVAWEQLAPNNLGLRSAHRSLGGQRCSHPVSEMRKQAQREVTGKMLAP